VQDQKSQNTSGGTFTAGSWQTRTLNTIVNDSSSLVSIASNHIVLPAGTYEVSAIAPCCGVDRHQARLRDITNSVTLCLGLSYYNSLISAIEKTGNALVIGRFILSGVANVELQHQCQTTRATDGFGLAANFGIEVYASVELHKVA
jgi:hypothetical protein